MVQPSPHTVLEHNGWKKRGGRTPYHQQTLPCLTERLHPVLRGLFGSSHENSGAESLLKRSGYPEEMSQPTVQACFCFNFCVVLPQSVCVVFSQGGASVHLRIHNSEPEGDILLFLTGEEEIEQACRLLDLKSSDL